MSSPRIAVITGQPGVGKSTICAQLAARREVAAHVKADDLHRMIVSGGEWPSGRTAAAHRQLLARTRNAAQVASNLAVAGVQAFIDEVVVLPEQVEILDSHIGSAHWIVLTASRATITRRDAQRPEHTAVAYLELGAAIEQLLEGRASVIHTDGLDPDQTRRLVDEAIAGPAFEPDARGPVWWLVEVTVEPEDLGHFEALTLEMLEAARDEAGTLTYERYRVNDTTFHFHERYESDAAAIHHIERFQLRFSAQLAAVVTRRRFHLYGPASPRLRAALQPFGATATHRYPTTSSLKAPHTDRPASAHQRRRGFDG